MDVKLSYGRTGLQVALPEQAQATVISPRFVPGLDDEPSAMRDALRDPIGSRPLRELVSPSDTVAVVFSDITRPRFRLCRPSRSS